MTNMGQFEQLIAAGYPCIAITTYEEQEAVSLVRDAAMGSGGNLWVWSMCGGMRDAMMADAPAMADTEHPAAALYHLSVQLQPPMTVMLDLAGHLKDERTLRLLREVIECFARRGSTLILIDHLDQLPAVVRATIVTFALPLPQEAELEEIVRNTLRTQAQRGRLAVDLTRDGLTTIVRNMRGLTARQARQVIMDVICEDRRLDLSDLNRILAAKRKLLQGEGLLEFIESPVDLAEIGGLNRLKAWLQQRQVSMTIEAVEFGLSSPRGVLMLGVQGAGKSLAAKAVATAWRLPLMRMDAGALYDKYIGESERRLRDSLRQAEMMAPLVLWIDEIEKAFASAASRSVDGGLSQRMFGTILTWMQEHTAPVFLIATANDIEALPPELLRKGRFDEIFFVDLPTRQAREQILAIHLKRRKRQPEAFDLAALAEASEGYSGSEIEQAVISGLHAAFAAGTQLSTRQLVEALRASPPLSVTMAERVRVLREWSQGRCVPAD